ncbi:MAG: triple tyrosine motif-containing protein, partial [Clostridium sp.]
KNNQIGFSFFSTYYLSHNKMEYAYKLSGVNEDWIRAENRNYVNYTNLEPGNYTFEVSGKSFVGEWSVPTVINITISNPPWKTSIAYSIYLFVILASIFIIWNRVNILNALVRQRTNELNKRLKENKELYAQLLKHEKYKNNYFVNLSHELRTPLNIIVTTQNLIENLNNKDEHIPKEKIGNYICTMKRNSNRLISLIDNIIYTSKIESGAYDLNIEEIDIVYLVEEATLSMKEFVD